MIHNHNPHAKEISKKIYTLLAWLCTGIFLLYIRLFYLQIICADHLRARGNNNFLRLESIPASRGIIVDCNDKILALNRPIFNIYWDGSKKNNTEKELENNYQVIRTIFPELKKEPHFYAKLRRATRQKTIITIAQNVSFIQLCQVQEQLSKCANITIESCEKRHYPHSTKTTHFVGYVSNQDAIIQGQAGLERLYNQQLTGKSGTRLKTINSVGSIIEDQTIQEPIAGKNLKTTLDIDLQIMGDTVFPDHFKGALLLMDPSSGAIRALISKPSFCPHLFLDPISSEDWKRLQENNPFLNRALNAYPPGSIFKLVSVSAALEQGIIQEDDSWFCKGYHLFANRRYWCHKHSGHGLLDTAHAVGQSCNILFFEVAKQISIDIFADYAHRFGLGFKTGSLFTEKEGLVPNTQWKREKKGEPWWPGETLSAAIGQSYLLATPIQIARMVGSIFTGFLIQPRILEDEPLLSIPLDLKDRTIAFLKKSMKSVITHGTGKKVNTLKDFELYAKTSTAQIGALGKQVIDKSFLEHGWFVTYFQYKQEKPLVLVVLVENAGSAQVATTIARDFLIAYKRHCDIN